MSKHLTLSDRVKIATALNAEQPIYQIAKDLGKDRTTISREIRKHITIVDKGAPLRIKNRCIYRHECKLYGLCENKPDCTRKCRSCSRCNAVCSSFVEEKCTLLSSAPYVCNGCKNQHTCVLMKSYYIPDTAQEEYRELLTTAREGYNMTTLELKNIDEKISPLLKNGHSIHHAFIVSGDSITVSESTVSRLVKDRQLSATVMDQQRVVKLKPRKKPHPDKKVDRHCRENRSYSDYLSFMKSSSNCNAVEMDTVIGKIGGKSLLTLILPNCEVMLAFLCDCHTAACVQTKIDYLYDGLGEMFHTLFPVILTDNGSEFSNPKAIETTAEGIHRTNVFYCDPMASWQKPHVERNHEFIRLICPKGTSFDNLTQEKVGLMMSHINSYARPSLGDKSPFDVFAYLYGEETLQKLLRLVCQTKILPKDIILKPSLLK